MKFREGDRVLLIDRKERTYLVTLKAGGSFHFHRGIVLHDDLIGQSDGSQVLSTEGEKVTAFVPRYPDFVLKMPRGAQVIYPKDSGAIITYADIYPGAKVFEAGIGSGALTIALLRAIGSKGSVVAYEQREDFAANALSNVESFMGGPQSNLVIQMKDAYGPIEDGPFDRAVLDLSEPWRVIPALDSEVRAGGIVASYLPTIVQSQTLTEELRARGWTSIVTMEVLIRTWHIEERSVRPDHRMVGHTGFLTFARKVGP
ncbi:MAG TPA: tRNA (adenine-N1)-methyltransferase [Actinomycetota bacterium]|nr:tRNA (adenine-N1)-methyltransferase [Actinomycetota bacterium]